MNKFGEIKIEKNIPTGEVEDTIEGNKKKKSVRKYPHIGADEINNWRDKYDRNAFFGALGKSVVRLQDKLADVQKWYNNNGDKNLGNNFKNDDPENTSRRKFLKTSLAGLVGVGMVTSGLDSVAEWIDKQHNKEIALSWQDLSLEEKKQVVNVVKRYDAVISIEEVPNGNSQAQQIVFTFAEGGEGIEELSEEEQLTKIDELSQEKISTTDYKIFEKLFVEQYLKDGSIDINLKVKSGVQEAWDKKYDKGGVLHKGLLESLDRMKPWYKEIKEIFKNTSQAEGVDIPEELIYLAIPESHCKTRDKSSASAGGYYQLMKLIARDKNLVIENGIDERFDILENARAASEYLAELYKEFKTEQNTEEDTWRLTLARYNGVYSRRFKNYVKDADYLKNYKTFLEFRESKLNKYLEVVFSQGYFEGYRVKKGESLESIADKYELNLEELRMLNHPAKKFVKTGTKINIPVFRNKFEYKVQQGDNLWHIAKMYGVTREAIMSHPNNIGKIDELYQIKRGTILTIEIDDQDKSKLKQSLETIFKVDLHSALENLNYPEKFYAILNALERRNLLFKDADDTVKMEKIKGAGRTLKEISIEKGIAAKSLGVVNPHILKSNVVIPDGVMVYISPKIIVTKHHRTKRIIGE